MSTRSIVIIGAGIAGLSAGCYARMNGYATQIFEAHNQPGGLCTSWRRRSFTFDGCIHHLAGAGPASKIYTIWDELGVLQRHQMHYFDDLVRVELPDGQGVTIYTDLDRLEGALKSLAPEDGPVIDEYLSAARRFLGFELLAMPLLTARDVPGLIGRLPSVLKWGRITLDQFAERFSNPLLRQAVPTLQYDFANIPVLLHLSFLAGCADLARAGSALVPRRRRRRRPAPRHRGRARHRDRRAPGLRRRRPLGAPPPHRLNPPTTRHWHGACQ